MRDGGSDDRPAVFFDGPEDFRAWLEEHHESVDELWMGLNKKHVADRGLTWEQAVPEALCFGWIDSKVQRTDEDSVRQRWTPRRSTSVWSTVNLDLVERLAAEGRMRPMGLAAHALRKPERSGIYAYEQGGALVLPDPYAALLASNPAVAAFWAECTESYRKVCTSWVTSAKQTATNDKRMAQLVELCAAGQVIPSQRYGTEPAWLRRAGAAAAEATSGREVRSHCRVSRPTSRPKLVDVAWFSRKDKDAVVDSDEERPGSAAPEGEDTDLPEYDPCVPLRPRINAVGDEEQQRIDAGLAALAAEGVDVDDLASLGARYDAALAAWHKTSKRHREDDAVVTERFAIGIGEHLSRHTDLHWSLVRDAFGTDLAVASGRDEFVVVPTNLVTARWFNGERGWLPGVVGHLVHVRASH